jgi:hypothetical protein
LSISALFILYKRRYLSVWYRVRIAAPLCFGFYYFDVFFLALVCFLMDRINGQVHDSTMRKRHQIESSTKHIFQVCRVEKKSSNIIRIIKLGEVKTFFPGFRCHSLHALRPRGKYLHTNISIGFMYKRIENSFL